MSVAVIYRGPYPQVTSMQKGNREGNILPLDYVRSLTSWVLVVRMTSLEITFDRYVQEQLRFGDL
jgi:hypothetical protein